MKTVMKIVVAGVILLLLTIGGCAVLLGGAANEVAKEMEAEEKNDKPTAVQAGKPFTHDGYKVDGGWKVADDGLGDATINNLKVTNTKKTIETPMLTFTFVKGTEKVATVECNAGELEPGQSTVMDCISGADLPKPPYEIRVADMW